MVSLENFMDERKKTVEDIMHHYLGVSIKELNDDITEKLSDPLLDYDVDDSLRYKDAKKVFLKRYVLRMIFKHSGNITSAAKEAHIDRRTFHRMIKEFNVDVEEIRRQSLPKEYLTGTRIYSVIETSIRKYEDFLHPNKVEDLYHNVHKMSKNILESTFHAKALTMKQAEREFDRHFLSKVIKKHDGNLSLSAKTLRIRYETLHRKLKAIKYHSQQ